MIESDSNKSPTHSESRKRKGCSSTGANEEGLEPSKRICESQSSGEDICDESDVEDEECSDEGPFLRGSTEIAIEYPLCPRTKQVDYTITKNDLYCARSNQSIREEVLDFVNRFHLDQFGRQRSNQEYWEAIASRFRLMPCSFFGVIVDKGIEAAFSQYVQEANSAASAGNDKVNELNFFSFPVNLSTLESQLDCWVLAVIYFPSGVLKTYPRDVTGDLQDEHVFDDATELWIFDAAKVMKEQHVQSILTKVKEWLTLMAYETHGSDWNGTIRCKAYNMGITTESVFIADSAFSVAILFKCLLHNHQAFMDDITLREKDHALYKQVRIHSARSEITRLLVLLGCSYIEYKSNIKGTDRGKATKSETSTFQEDVSLWPPKEFQKTLKFIKDIEEKKRKLEVLNVRKDASEVAKEEDYFKPFDNPKETYYTVVITLLKLISQCPWDILVPFRNWLRTLKDEKQTLPAEPRDHDKSIRLAIWAYRCTRGKKFSGPWKKIAFLFLHQQSELLKGDAKDKFAKFISKEKARNLLTQAKQLYGLCQSMTRNSIISVFLLDMMGITMRHLNHDWKSEDQRLLCMFFIPSPKFKEELCKVMDKALIEMILLYTHRSVKTLEIVLDFISVSKSAQKGLSPLLKRMMVKPTNKSVTFGHHVINDKDAPIYRMIPKVVDQIDIETHLYASHLIYHSARFKTSITNSDLLDIFKSIRWTIKFWNLDITDPRYDQNRAMYQDHTRYPEGMSIEEKNQLIPSLAFWVSPSSAVNVSSIPILLRSALSTNTIEATEISDSNSSRPMPYTINRIPSMIKPPKGEGELCDKEISRTTSESQSISPAPSPLLSL